MTDSREATAVQNLQKIGTNMFDPSWAGTRVECLAYYDRKKSRSE